MLQCGELDQSGYFVTVRGGHENDRPSSENSDEETLGRGREPELKLWICDLLNINKIGVENTNYYSFRGISVNIVDIYAVITAVLQNKFGVIYKVDDGTGEICCWHSRQAMEDREGLKKNLSSVMENIMTSSTATTFNDTLLSSSEPDEEEALPSQSAVEQAAHWMKEQILAHSETSSDSLQVGNTVQIRGKLSDFRNERCIVIYNVRPVYDINEETDRRFELISLYETVYLHNRT